VDHEERDVIRASGAVLWRERAGGGIETAVVHRPRYDDWSLPKGKLDAGETATAAAVREIAEETGFRAVLGRYLLRVGYSVGGVPKVVDYWAARACSGAFAANDEVDELRWLSPEEALPLLSHPHDHEVLAAFTALPADLSTVLLVRHAKAGKRENWHGDDDLRPLSPAGWRQAEAVRDLLPLFGVTRVHAAPRLRCVQTVRGAADDLGVPVLREPRLSEEGYWPDPDAGLVRFLEIVRGGGVSAVSSQGGVIPALVGSLADMSGLRPGEVHSKKGSTWVLSFTRPSAPWSTSDSAATWPKLVAAHYLASPLPAPVPR
jgi:8-oxo-dGTP diphosphatase